MKTILITTILLSTLLLSCEKTEKLNVTYMISEVDSGFEVNYRDESGNMINQSVDTESMMDVWTFVFKAEPGHLVFVSARYHDIHSSILVRILIDGKVYKQSATKGDTLSFVTVSGTVPF
jgi:hypothetical protein